MRVSGSCPPSPEALTGGTYQGDPYADARLSAYRAALHAQIALAETWVRRLDGVLLLVEPLEGIRAARAVVGSVRRLRAEITGNTRSLKQHLGAVEGGAYDEVG